MSRKQTDENIIRIQFSVKKGETYFDTVQEILQKKEYKSSIKANSIKIALTDLLRIFKMTGTVNSNELIQKFFKRTNNNSIKDR